MIKQFRLFLGPARERLLFLLLAFTGLANLTLNAAVDESPWARDAQTMLAIVFLVGTAAIILSAMDAYTRGRWIGILIPALGAVILGLLFPQFLGLAVGLGLGWIVAGALVFRPRGPEEYRRAVKHLRKDNYKDAVEEMTTLIKREPERPEHYRFRAELLRVWGKLDRAKRDYRKMTELAPDTAVAWNGLAEVLLQSGEYDAARNAALKALELAPDEWVAAYNLGMIDDRLGDADAAIQHLNEALRAKVPEKRHELLIHLYLARAHARRGATDAAAEAVEHLRKLRSALEEWETILSSEQAGSLRAVIQEDVNTAQALADGEIDAAALAKEAG